LVTQAFHGKGFGNHPLSREAADQLYDLDVLLTEKLANPKTPDSWEYNWGNIYLPKKSL
jgi:hypothetical protein